MASSSVDLLPRANSGDAFHVAGDIEPHAMGLAAAAMRVAAMNASQERRIFLGRKAYGASADRARSRA